MASIVLTGLFQDATSLAANVTPVYLDKEIGYYDSDVPPAIRLNESYDGLVAGTYLYRTQHVDLTYYTPVTPQQYRDTVHEPSVNVQYRTWGPWKMAKNQIGFTPVATRKIRYCYYSSKLNC